VGLITDSEGELGFNTSSVAIKVGISKCIGATPVIAVGADAGEDGSSEGDMGVGGGVDGTTKYMLHYVCRDTGCLLSTDPTMTVVNTHLFAATALVSLLFLTCFACL
jgi:hypothetical protein